MKTHTSLKVAVLGAGSIGCYLGGQLVKGGADVMFIGRPRFQKDLAEQGLTLTHYERSDIVLTPDAFQFALTPEAAAGCDIVLVCVKSQDSTEAARSIKPFLDKEALVISFQNGVRNADAIQAELPASIVLGAIVPFNVTGTGAGRFHSGTEGDLIVQSHDDPRVGALVGAFGGGGQILKTVPDVKAVQWGKLLVNLNNGLNTLLGGTLHEGLRQKPYRLALSMMIEEGLSVLKGAGITPAQFGKTSITKTIKTLRLPNILFAPIMRLILRIDKRARSSMLDDLEMGRGTEIDYLQGEIVKLAESTGQSAPINAAVMARVKAAFLSGRSPKMSGKDIVALCRGAA
ncbi:MAG: 2-dehydropantoate 2-reductase [Alphaproteobacteria bacterium]